MKNLRHRWTEAVWSSSLSSSELLVALCFADHAQDPSRVWVTYPRLMARTRKSRDTVARALKALCAGGWLTVVEEARQHSATRYALTLPEGQQSDHRTPGDSQQSDGRTSGEAQQSDFAAQQSDGADPAVRSSDSIHVLSMTNRSMSAPAGAMDDDHDCDNGWIENDDGSVSRCPRCRPKAEPRNDEPTDDLAHHLSRELGRTVTPQRAREISDQILAGRKVHNPTRYVLATVRKDPARYRPAPSWWERRDWDDHVTYTTPEIA